MGSLQEVFNEVKDYCGGSGDTDEDLLADTKFYEIKLIKNLELIPSQVLVRK